MRIQFVIRLKKTPDRKSSDRYLIVSLLPMVVGPKLSVAAFQIYLSFDTVTSEFNTPPKAAYCFLMQDCHFTQSVNWIRHQMYPDQEHRNNGGSCHLKRYKKGLHLFEQQVKTKQICQQLSPNDWLEFVCKWLYDTLECTFILCRLQNQSTLIHLQRSFESFKIHAVCITMQSLRFTRYTKTTPTVLKTKWSVPRVFGTPQPSGNRQDTVLPR